VSYACDATGQLTSNVENLLAGVFRCFANVLYRMNCRICGAICEVSRTAENVFAEFGDSFKCLAQSVARSKAPRLSNLRMQATQHFTRGEAPSGTGSKREWLSTGCGRAVCSNPEILVHRWSGCARSKSDGR